jgi:exonuclease SbcD
MIRFIHTADIHIGVENYGKIDSATGMHTRLIDFHRAFSFCIDTAIEQKVDFFLFAGDAYKTTHPSPTQQKLFLASLLRLHAAGIPVIIIVGNHDNPLSFGKAHTLDIFEELPLEGFHVIKKPSILRLETKNGPAQIVGIPWPTRTTIALSDEKQDTQTGMELTTYISSAVSTIIANYAQKLDPVIPAILAGHLTVSSGVFSGSEKRAIYGTDPLFLPSHLAKEPFDYVALGHLHRHQNLNPQGIPIVYCGSVERIDFGERNEQKGFCLVTIQKNSAGKKTKESSSSASYEFIPTPTRPFIQIEVTLQSGRSQTEQLLQEMRCHNLKDAIVKIMYHLPADEKDMVDLQVIQRAASDAMHLVDILPIRQQSATRKYRAAVKVDMDLKTLLENYFATKPEYATKKDILIEKALQLYEEAQIATEEK